MAVRAWAVVLTLGVSGSLGGLAGCGSEPDKAASPDGVTAPVLLAGSSGMGMAGNVGVAGPSPVSDGVTMMTAAADPFGGAQPQAGPGGADDASQGAGEAQPPPAPGASAPAGEGEDAWPQPEGTRTGTPTPSAGSGSAVADPAPEPEAEPCVGAIRYRIEQASTDGAVRDVYARITAAMDGALAIYNCHTAIDKALRVSYVPAVQTADGNPNGSIRFGAVESMNRITAMHEISHTLGIGDSRWDAMVVNGVFPGARATAQLREITGNPEDVVHGDNQHFWPYGLNYTNEVMGEQDLIDHCRMVAAIREDLGY